MRQRLTYSRFQAMTPSEQTTAYLTHEANEGKPGKNDSEGPSTVAQADFTNDWRQAFSQFASKLPNY